MGESAQAVDDGTQEALMPYLTCVNIACGGHAGNESMMRATVRQAQRWRLQIGAHPGYPDAANFGRVALSCSEPEVEEFVFEQVTALAAIAGEAQQEICHVKPHGALYNSAVANRKLAAAVAAGVARWRQDVTMVGLAGSPMLEEFEKAGFQVAGEAFADRRYEADGSLRARHHPDALITNPEEAARQVREIVRMGWLIAVDGSHVPIAAQTFCIHSDTPGALAIARAVSEELHTHCEG